jgi:hypothetical protein
MREACVSLSLTGADEALADAPPARSNVALDGVLLRTQLLPLARNTEPHRHPPGILPS